MLFLDRPYFYRSQRLFSCYAFSVRPLHFLNQARPDEKPRIFPSSMHFPLFLFLIMKPPVGQALNGPTYLPYHRSSEDQPEASVEPAYGCSTDKATPLSSFLPTYETNLFFLINATPHHSRLYLLCMARWTRLVLMSNMWTWASNGLSPALKITSSHRTWKFVLRSTVTW